MSNRATHKLGLGNKLLLAVAALAAVVGPVAIGIVCPAPGRARSQRVSPTHPTIKFVLGDLKIEGEVYNRDGVSERILNAWRGRDYDDLKDLTDEVMESGLRKDFQDRGYFEVVVQDSMAKLLGLVDGEQRILIVATVTEGNQFRLGKFTIQNDPPDRPLNIPEATVREQFHLRQGDLFNVSEVRAGMERLKHLYHTEGYGAAKEQPATAVDSAHHLIDLTIRIAEGPRAK